MIQRTLAIWSLVPLPFLNPACTSGSSSFRYCWSLAWSILSITLLACEISTIIHSLALPFFGIGMKTDFNQSCGHCWVFQICWHIGCNALTASSFRIWNSSSGIPSPPLALFVASKATNCQSYFDASKDPLDFTLRDVMLSDHTMLVIWVMKTFLCRSFCVFLPSPFNLFYFC